MQRQPTAKEKSSTLGRGGAHNDGRAQSTRSTPPSANRNSRRIPAPLLLLLFSMTASSCSNCFVSAAAAGESRRPRPAGRRSTHNLKNRLRRTNTNAEEEESALPSTNPSIGTFNALIVLVQFPEHSNRTLPPPSYFQNLCNTEIVPYLLDQSYQQYLIKDCDVLPWRVTNQSQAYFANGESNMKGEDRAADFAAPVLDQWDADDSIDWSKYDRDGDGLLDAVMLVHSGWSAEMLEGLECGAAPWDQRLRSQAFSGSDDSWSSRRTEGAAVRLFGYGIASALRNVCDSTPAEMDVITHEWLHTLGTIDLYDTGSFVWTIPGGIGSFDIMANADGPRYDGTPGSLSPYSKMQAGWLEPIEIMYDGVYTARTSNRHPDVYIIKKGYGEGEYLLIENRHVVDWDAILPGNGGLLIYHIDEDVVYQDRPGFPDAPYWPHDHYLVALLQADGNYDLERGNNNGDAGDYFSANTRPLLPGGRGNFPNSDSYQFGTLVQTGIRIVDISEPGLVMTFRVSGLGAPPSTAAPTANTIEEGEDAVDSVENNNDNIPQPLQNNPDNSSKNSDHSAAAYLSSFSTILRMLCWTLAISAFCCS